MWREFEDLSVDQWKERFRGKPSLGRARGLARAIVNTIGDVDDPAEKDGLLAELRGLRRTFGSDENLAKSHGMALANAALEADSDEILERNRRLLDELRTVTWEHYSGSGFDVTIMAAQYLGLLKQARYEEASAQLAEMADLAFGGSPRERLEWLIAVRHGFWILLEQQEFSRVNDQIELVREFQRRHPGDDYEAPHALLAMLLGDFEAAERRGDTALADRRFEEACSLGSRAKDWYGHVERLYRELSSERLAEPTRGHALARRLAATWQLTDSDIQ